MNVLDYWNGNVKEFSIQTGVSFKALQQNYSRESCDTFLNSPLLMLIIYFNLKHRPRLYNNHRTYLIQQDKNRYSCIKSNLKLLSF